MRIVKVVFAVVFSLLLIFLTVPVLPDTVYADTYDDLPTIYLPDYVQEFYQSTGLLANVKIPGATGEKVCVGSKGAPEAITATTFHDSTLPDEGWVAIDADGDGYGWFYAKDDVDGLYWSVDGQDSECLVSASYRNDVGKLTPDNWLISPAVTVPEGSQIQFYVGGQDPDYCAEHYGVFIGTTSQTDTSAFGKLYEGTVTRGGGGFDGIAVDLTEYAGQTVYIAFRHYDSTDQFVLNLDGICFAAAGTDPGNIEQPPTVIRVKGKDRYETSLAVALEILKNMSEGWKFPNAIIATGDNFPDALAGSSLSTLAVAPILLIGSKSPESIDNAVAFIEEHVDPEGYVFILGGKGAVPESVENKLNAIGANYYRFAGKNRYETNLEVIATVNENRRITKLLVCDGTNWPDAATSSATGNAIMLVSKKGLNDDQKAFLDYLYWLSIHYGGLQTIYVIGGKGAVSEEISGNLRDYVREEDVRRLYGANRADTAVAVARALFKTSSVKSITFAYASNFPDCISGGLMAYRFRSPILYADNNKSEIYVNANVPYISETKVWTAFVLGGASLISDELVNDMYLATLELQ